jgi:hypothetical protein
MELPFAAFKPMLVKIKQLGQWKLFTGEIIPFTVRELSIV